MTDKPPYRVPSMDEIAAVPWNGYRVVSTFSGCGGSCLGFKMAGFKVLGASADIDSLMVDLYYGMKRANGYTQEQIDRKRLSLEGVLVPVTARWNEELLRMAGFTQVDCFWRWMNFAGWLAVK